MVADLHTITTPYDVEELKKNRREVIIDYLAAGLDPEKSVIFQQAEVPEHAELAFYFSSVVTIARMQHLPTFKEKVTQHPDSATMALLNYPILMAADILVYKAGLVPVGIDQEPHLEVARVIANNMNSRYGTDFPEPQRFATKGQYVPSLTGEGKMSKSVEGSYINLTDDMGTITSKIARIPTDSGRGVVQNTGGVTQYISNGQVANGTASLVSLASIYDPNFRQQFNSQYESGVRYGDIKKEIGEKIYNDLQEFREKRKEIEANTAYVDKVIKEGAEKARIVAQQTMREVKEKMGLG
jgi:tryptophanyl-tRNA synthetase